MKRIQVAVAMLMLSFGLCVAGDAPEIRDNSDRISYSIGYQIGGDFRRQGTDLKADLVVQGIQDALKGNNPRMTPEEMNRTLVEVKRKVTAAQQEDQKRAAEKNLAEGKRFLQENAKKDGVATLPSGLQYRVIEKGAGDSPKKTDRVTVHYKGTLVDGTEFDSSYKRGIPATFRVTGVIAGWTEALQLMKPGAKWMLYVPSNLAYGERGSGAKIPPNSTLIFEVELLNVN